MTTKLEEQFFKVFGIEKKCVRGCGEYYFENVNIDAWSEYDCKNSDCSKCEHDKSIWEYPEITNDILLQMICILNETSCEVLQSENTEDLKNEILETCIKVYNTPILTSDGDEYENTAIYDKIQQLFKEEK